ncbi:glycosyltransferase family 2 protein [Helicobacter sp. MIT 14-3879]|uniref:glycosyltransferase family 2 protein n=1 Tax=Helicobacter sp. MIT 14-3879 TaxID=2040649 RepID=UPI000E1EB8CE|nr:glycosyltransferase [Helicobacter sp. MIT 14-3879]RDU65199.1 hypothetical protein CQA44_02475 [Helicobacter sp. MIT 14-3879]
MQNIGEQKAEEIFSSGGEFLEISDNIVVDSELIFKQENLAKNPKFSIAIPTYNRLDTLKEALASAFNQDFRNGGQSNSSNKNRENLSHYEILVVENTDDFNSISQTQKYLEENYKNKITYYKNHKNLGLFGNFNSAIALSCGEWVCILHDDDILLPNYLSAMNEATNRVDENTSLISSRAIYFGNLSLIGYEKYKDSKLKAFVKAYAYPLFSVLKYLKHTFMKGIIYKVLRIKTYKKLDVRSCDYVAKYNPFHPSALLHHRELFFKIGGYNNRFYPSDDWFFHIRCARHSKVYQLNEFLSKYRYFNNATFNKNTMLLGSIVDYLHLRDNINISKQMKDILFQKRLELISKIDDIELRERIITFMQVKPRKLNLLEKLMYKIYIMNDVELYKAES